MAFSLSLVLPSPVQAWVAALAVTAAAVSQLVKRGRPFPPEEADTAPNSVIEDTLVLETTAMVVRSVALAHDLPAALHGVARTLVQQLGADGLMTGRLAIAGARFRLDRFDAGATRWPVSPQEPMSAVAEQAIQSRRVASTPGGFAVPVLCAGDTVAWLEFKSMAVRLNNAVLLRLLDLVQRELSAVAERRAPAPATPVGVNAGLKCAPLAAPARVLLTRYPQRHATAAGARPVGSDVLDENALARLQQLDPNGVNRLLERIARAFEATAARMVPQLRERAGMGDLVGLQQVVGMLKSAAATVGAVRLSLLCAEIESMVRADIGDNLASRVKTMVSEIDVVISVLRGLPAHQT